MISKNDLLSDEGVKTIAKLSVNAMANLGEAHDGSQSEKCFLEAENMPSVCTH